MVVCFANAACGADAGTATAAPARTNAEQSIPGLCWYRHTQRASGPCPRALDPTLRSCCFSHAGADPQVPQKEAHRDEGRIQTPAYVTVDDPGLPLPQTLRRRSEPDLECRADSLVRVRVNYIADGACSTYTVFDWIHGAVRVRLQLQIANALSRHRMCQGARCLSHFRPRRERKTFKEGIRAWQWQTFNLAARIAGGTQQRKHASVRAVARFARDPGQRVARALALYVHRRRQVPPVAARRGQPPPCLSRRGQT